MPDVELLRPNRNRSSMDVQTLNGTGEWNYRCKWYDLSNRQLGRRVVKKVIDLWSKNRLRHDLRTGTVTYHNHHGERYEFFC